METEHNFDQKVSVFLYNKESDLINRYFNEFFSKIEKTIPNNNDVMLKMKVPNPENLKNVMDKTKKNTNVLTCIVFPSLFVTEFVSVYLHVTLVTEITPLFKGESQLFTNRKSNFLVYCDDQALVICENMGLKEK